MLRLIAAISLAIVLSVIYIALAFVVFARQDAAQMAALQPIVINIEQAVPANVTLALPQTDGSVITATTPITVAVALQIKLDGAQLVTVTAPPAARQPTTAITVAIPTPTPAVPDNAPIYASVRWQLSEAKNTGATFDDPDDTWIAQETRGNFVVVDLAVKNIGADPVKIRFGEGYDYGIALQDSAGRRYERSEALYGNGCFNKDLNPGIDEICRILFEVPDDATGLSLILVGEDGEQAIPLGF